MVSGSEVKPSDIVREAKLAGCKSISYTYTEPTIFFEYAYDIVILARKEGLYNNFVTNGYMTIEAIEAIKPYLDSANVDLKGFSEEFYQKFCQAHLEPVLESIRTMKKLGYGLRLQHSLYRGRMIRKKILEGSQNLSQASVKKSHGTYPGSTLIINTGCFSDSCRNPEQC